MNDEMIAALMTTRDAMAETIIAADLDLDLLDRQIQALTRLSVDLRKHRDTIVVPFPTRARPQPDG